MWPKMWTPPKTNAALSWKSVPFEPAQKSSVADTPGVYAFIITTTDCFGISASYLMYIGQTTEQTLRVRFGQYINEIGSGKGRPKLVGHLPKYKGFIYFHFAEIQAEGTATPEQIEDQLLSFFIPPLNSSFKGVISQFRAAFPC